MRRTSLWFALILSLAPASPAAAEKRVALVIGNGAYVQAPKLPNPKNDAEDVSAALKRVGFEVIVGLDLDKPSMDNAAIRFARAARDADVAIFYYSGHAMQYAGVNYLMPVDAKLTDEADLRLMVRTDSIVADLQQAKNLRILVLDSCRDNPIAEELKRSIGRTRAAGLSRGLAKIDTPEGMIVAYATQAGRTAEDGRGRNSPYTTAFLKYIEQQDEIGTVFRRISADVFETTKRTQLPELSLSLIGEYYLKGRMQAALPLPDNTEVAALREQLRLMQEQINRRDQAVLAPPAAPQVAPQAVAPSRPPVVAPPVAARSDSFNFPPPPEPAPVELGERAAASRVEASPRESGLVELGAQAAKQAVRDPFNLPAPPEPAPVEFGSRVTKQVPAAAVPARPQQQATRDPFNLPPPPEPAPVELGAHVNKQAALAPPASARQPVRDPFNLPPPPEPALVELGAQAATKRTELPPPPEPALVELGQQAALAARPLQSATPTTAPLRLLRSLKGDTPNRNGLRVAASFFPDGRRVVSLGGDGMIRQWNSETGALLRASKGNEWTDRVVLSPDGKRLAAGAFTDTFVYSGIGSDRSDPALSWKDYQPNRAGCTGNALAFSPDGEILAKAYPKSSVRLYNAATGKVIRTLPPAVGCQINAAAFSPDGRYLLDSTYRLWDVATGKLVRTLTGGEPIGGNDSHVVSMCRDGGRVAMATRKMFGVWSIDTGNPIWTVSNVNDYVSDAAIACSPDGRFVIGGRGKKIFVYDAASGRELQTVAVDRNVGEIAISSDGQRMLSFSRDSLQADAAIWEIAGDAISRR